MKGQTGFRYVEHFVRFRYIKILTRFCSNIPQSKKVGQMMATYELNKTLKTVKFVITSLVGICLQ